jgi:hypothetical protein
MKRLAQAATLLALLSLVVPLAVPCSSGNRHEKSFKNWTLEEAIEILTQSPWARQETFTRVVGGIGSGVLGEKEIYTTFYVRFLSARPVREAYARVQQIQAGYDTLGTDQKRQIDASLGSVLKLDSRRWIIVAVSYRSNDSSIELALKEFFEVQTADSIRSKAHLSTSLHPQLEPAAYFPPREEAVGAKFVFPRTVDGESVVNKEDPAVTFELDVPGFERDLRVTFPITGMVVDGEPVL